MIAGKMHIDEVASNGSLVLRLLAAQFPQWANLPIKSLQSAGTDNAIYRLGDDMAVRLPRINGATGQLDKEHHWLPKLAPFLPLAIPVPVAKGKPGEGYPWHWSVYRWLEGENTTIELTTDPRQAAIDLAQFIAALRRIDATGGPLSGPPNSSRGVPLAIRDQQTRAAIAGLHGILDADAVTAAWEAALRAPAWRDRPVWIHGDLHSGNLLAQQGRLTAVIDFGSLGVGDPACDVMAAWIFLSAETRDIFRALLQVDDATWARGRGWALSFGLIALPYYQGTNHVLARIARRAIDEALDRDHNKPGVELWRYKAF